MSTYPTTKNIELPVVVQTPKTYTKKDFRTFSFTPNTYNDDGTVKASGRVTVDIVYGNALDANGNLVVEYQEQQIWSDAEYEAFCDRNAALLGQVRDALNVETA